jgi:LacI family transcriptional regulator
MRRRGVSQGDVARLAGVSATAVSLVLNGKQSTHRLAPETVRRIHDAMTELRYRPNAVAQALVQGRTNTIGVVLGEADMTYLTNPYYGPALQGIVGLAFSQRRFVVLYHGGELIPSEIDATNYVDGRCDGLILTPPFTSEAITAPLHDMRFPFVTLGDSGIDPTIPGVDIDNESAGKEAAAYLLDQGHHHILGIAARHYSHSSLRRLEGCRGEVKRRGGTYQEVMLTGKGDKDVAEALQKYLREGDLARPTAIFCLTDQIALPVMRVLRALGKEIPRDFSVMGFDDAPEAAEARLTTVRQNPLQIGEEATRLLFRLINCPTNDWPMDSIKVTVPTALIERESVARKQP